MAPYLTDWRRQWRGAALAVVQPDTTEDVARVVRWCVQHDVPITPQGGNTGLSGGATPDASGRAVVMSLARLNRVRAVDLDNDTLTVEAGCVLSAVQQAAAAADRQFPLSLAAEGSCTVGGVLSTNAGGVAVLRYGNARDLCLGLEVVTAEGRIWNGLRALRKDNTGYDLRDLFIGSEGTLGVITAAVLKLYPAARSRQTAICALPSPAAALGLLRRARREAGPGLTAFELMSGEATEIALRHYPDLTSPFATTPPWMVLLEISDAPPEALVGILEGALDAGHIDDAVLAAASTHARRFWALRERLSEAQALEGRSIKHDVSVPISTIPDFVDVAVAQLQEEFPQVRPAIFGHLGDGNLHFNVLAARGAPADDLPALQDRINGLVHGLVAAHGGSISAEHGLGVLRRDEAARFKCPVELDLMRRIKSALDPAGMMNPGKVLV